jgi:hypothetical protein
MLEAKGPGFEWAMTSSTSWEECYRGTSKIMKQVHDQRDAAPNRRIEWHFAEKSVADYFRARFADEGLTNVTVFYTPAIWSKVI